MMMRIRIQESFHGMITVHMMAVGHRSVHGTHRGGVIFVVACILKCEIVWVSFKE